MTTSQQIDFGPDKSQILRGLAIIFMITLHNDTLPEFKICVPIFTFLVGYGYAFAKEKNLRHGLKRSWHLLSHFWLILLGLFLPVAIWKGGYEPTIGDVLLNMFGLESNLNWYSWYIYFYIFAMLAMIPASRLIQRFKLPALGALILLSLCLCFAIHLIPDWRANVYLQAIHDCFLCSPVMFSGFYLADGGGDYMFGDKAQFQKCVTCFACCNRNILSARHTLCHIFRLCDGACFRGGNSSALQYHRQAANPQVVNRAW